MSDDSIPSIAALLADWAHARVGRDAADDLVQAGESLVEALNETHTARLALAERNIALTAELAALRGAARTLLIGASR